MRVHFQTDGGVAHFPALQKALTVDTAVLPAQEAASLEELVRAAQFFSRPPESGSAAPGAADYRTYTISVEDSENSHTIRVSEPVQDPALEALINSLQNRQRSLIP